MDRLSIRRSGRPHATVLAACVSAAFSKALTCDTRLHPAFLAQEAPGFPGPRYRGFINNLIGAIPDARYLEIGSGTGFSAYAAIYNNNVAATCIDEWSLQPGTHAIFMTTLAHSEPRIRNVETIDADARTIDFARLRHVNVCLFDKSRAPRADGLKLALPALDDEFVFITNGWNDPRSKDEMDATVGAENLSRLFAIEIRTTDDGTPRQGTPSHGTPSHGMPSHGTHRTGDRADDFFVGVFRKAWAAGAATPNRQPRPTGSDRGPGPREPLA